MTKRSFLGDEVGCPNLTRSKIVIIPVPFDQTSTWQKGADKGPQAILEASPHLEFYDIETESEVFRYGIYTEAPIETDQSVQMIERVHRTTLMHLRQGRFPVVIGGEHSVTIGAVKAHVQHQPSITVLQLDAHSDMRDRYDGSAFSHACVMARVQESCPVVQVGIRSMDKEELIRIDQHRLFYAWQTFESNDWIDEVIDLLTDHVYVTIDLDVFDPGIMPSTGTPEPGGLNWYQIMKLLKRLSESRKITGFDVVELCPGDNKAPDFLAAKLIYQFLSYIWR